MALAALNKRFEDLFRSSHLITTEQLARATGEAEQNNEYLHQMVVDMRFAEASQVFELAQQEWGIETIDVLSDELASLDTDFVKRVFPEAMAFRIQSLPLNQTEDALFVAMVDPFDVFIRNEIRVRLHSRYKVKPYLAFPKDIEKKLDEVYERTNVEALDSVFDDLGEEEAAEMQTLDAIEDGDEEIDLETIALEQAQQSFVIGMVTKLIFQAVREGASDIHIEPFPRQTVLRYRIDGDLQERPMPSHTWHNALISRIKIMSGMDIAERRMPQDGRYAFKLGNKKYELRISIIPTVFKKESIVMRILDKGSITLPLPELGFSSRNLDLFEEAIHKPYGLILVCGPTGSGKSTTLFAALNAINLPEKKILTVENPVEYNLPGIVQVQTQEKIEPPLTFAEALKAFLRQDPDVIMVGEMRDLETAGIGVQAALTGHLVFSTIHTNDASSSIIRLSNLGVDPFLIGDALLLVIAQRLPRTLCKDCKTPVDPTDEQMEVFESYDIDTTNIQLNEAKGCDNCNGKGLKGRMAIHEVMSMSNDLREVISGNVTGHQVLQAALKNGMRTLRQDGLEKVVKGLMAIEEIMRITQDV